MQLITAETEKMYIRHKNKANFTIMSKIMLLAICNKEILLVLTFTCTFTKHLFYAFQLPHKHGQIGLLMFLLLQVESNPS